MYELQRLMGSIRLMGAKARVQPWFRTDLLLYSPCPVKLAVKESLDAIAAARAERGAEEVVIHIPMGCTSIDPFDPIYMEKNPDKLPSIIASIGFGDFWKKEFADHFVDTGLFEAVLPARINPLHEEAGMIDPEGRYTIYGSTPYIFMVDENLLGGLPIPRAWEDILHPRYKGRVIMCGDGDDMADAVLLNIFKAHGEEGVRRLAENSRSLMHSSVMAMVAGSADPNAGAIYIIPAFFAESGKRPAHVRVVWPDDGAAASPLYFLAKKSEKERLADVIEFFTEGFAKMDSAAWFTPIGRTDNSNLPANAKLKWVGWEFIKNNDINKLRDGLNASFRTMQKELW